MSELENLAKFLENRMTKSKDGECTLNPLFFGIDS